MRTETTPDTAQDTVWWQHPLMREIALVLMVKIALIFGLWWAFFDLPNDQHVDAAQVGAHVAGTALPVIRNHEDIPQ
ncbi:MAG: hypothetical protein KKE76_06470 [Gammaproteobacteria bacterium]|nr:hypothetical protein [Gammaproteobacteria bacterium]